MPSTTTLRAASLALDVAQTAGLGGNPGSSPWVEIDQHLLPAQVGEANLIAVLTWRGRNQGGLPACSGDMGLSDKRRQAYRD